MVNMEVNSPQAKVLLAPMVWLMGPPRLMALRLLVRFRLTQAGWSWWRRADMEGSSNLSRPDP